MPKNSSRVAQAKIQEQKSITYERTFCNIFNVRNPPPLSSKQEEAHDRVDAILAQIAESENILKLELHPWNAEHMLNDLEHETQISESPEIFAQLLEVSKHTDRMTVRFQLHSMTASVQEIRHFTETLYQNFTIARNADIIGDQLYVFEAVPPDCLSTPGLGARLQMSTDGAQQVDPNLLRREGVAQRVRSLKNQRLQFTRRSFITNKSYNNVFGNEARLLEKRIRFFKENPEFYNHRGIPYKIGALLEGVPGTGKTSLVGATAAYLKRHLILVKFDQIVTASRFRDLFFNEEITVYDNATQESRSIKLPIANRLYLIEEIDALGEIVHCRDGNHHGYNNYGDLSSVPDELTLAEILDVFDGNLQNPGRVMFITSNHAEKLDPALVRPGRIDLNLKFTYTDRQTMQLAYEHFFELGADPQNSTLFEDMPTNTLTMAEIHSVFMTHMDDKEAAYQGLCALASTKYFQQQVAETSRQREAEEAILLSQSGMPPSESKKRKFEGPIGRDKTPSPINLEHLGRPQDFYDAQEGSSFVANLTPLGW